MSTEAQKRANRKYEIEKTENIRVRVPKGKKALVQECAKANNESVNSMINRLIDNEIELRIKK